ncbi:MAG: N-acetyl-gamma-glutamyl-phosphate reductase [Clostridiales bacterium]|nr:N-acetyl-gamma-glutamyl-phosphate reductase [Clostridiales bacterium]
MKPKVYIDGKEGTTGLQIYERLGSRTDIDLLLIDEEKRKDTAARQKLLRAADLAFLCVPDAAAREAVALAEHGRAKLIDASTAHRTEAGWVYGFPELLAGQRQRVEGAGRVANPGCHATGFLSTVAPLVALGVLPRDYPVPCYSLTGYSGGGKQLIAEYESADRDPSLASPNLYALDLRHKHLPEMQQVAGLAFPPLFSPILGDIYQGMATSVLLQNSCLIGAPTAADLRDMLAAHYEGQAVVTVAPLGGRGPRLATDTFAGTDRLELTVCGHETQTMLTARFDNLGKGASGAAVQNMNLMLGFAETEGLQL